jgi:hypothetical protein
MKAKLPLFYFIFLKKKILDWKVNKIQEIHKLFKAIIST